MLGAVEALRLACCRGQALKSAEKQETECSHVMLKGPSVSVPWVLRAFAESPPLSSCIQLWPPFSWEAEAGACPHPVPVVSTIPHPLPPLSPFSLPLSSPLNAWVMPP